MKKKTFKRVLGVVIIVFLVALGVMLIVHYGGPPPIGMNEPYSFQPLPGESNAVREYLSAPQALMFGPNDGNVVFVRELPHPKSVWDWLEILIVPSILLGIGYKISERQKVHTERLNSLQDYLKQRQDSRVSQEVAMQRLFDGFSEVMVGAGANDAGGAPDVWHLMRARTLTTLSVLEDDANKQNKQIILQFLRDADLISRADPKISLSGARLKKIDFVSQDLSDLDLHGADLTGANFEQAILRNAQLAGANLTAATLHNADLGKAVLTNANLHEAKLRYATLSHADLRVANLSQAVLTNADLTGADVGGADFTDADFTEAVFEEVMFDEQTTWPSGAYAPPSSARQVVANVDPETS